VTIAVPPRCPVWCRQVPVPIDPFTTFTSPTGWSFLSEWAKCQPGNTQNGGTVLPIVNLWLILNREHPRLVSEIFACDRPTDGRTTRTITIAGPHIVADQQITVVAYSRRNLNKERMRIQTYKNAIQTPTQPQKNVKWRNFLQLRATFSKRVLHCPAVFWTRRYSKNDCKGYMGCPKEVEILYLSASVDWYLNSCSAFDGESSVRGTDKTPTDII